MDRRRFLLTSLAGALATPLAATAQPAPKPARIALVCGARCEAGGYDVFRQELRELGWVEGRNLVVDVRGAEGQPDRLPALVAKLVAGRPDIIVAVAPQPARAAKDAAGAIPVVFVAVADPIAARLVASLARPAGNVTGLSTLVPGGFMGKMLQVLRDAIPTASRIAVLCSTERWNDWDEFAHLRLDDRFARLDHWASPSDAPPLRAELTERISPNRERRPHPNRGPLWQDPRTPHSARG